MVDNGLVYFAYGSNLHPEWLKRRTPSAQVMGRARLPAHHLCFHKRGRDGSAKCDAWYTGDPNDGVHGVLYGLKRGEREALDRAEDLGRGYAIHPVRVETAGITVAVFTYRALPTAIGPDLPPFDWYLAYVVLGARWHVLPLITSPGSRPPLPAPIPIRCGPAAIGSSSTRQLDSHLQGGFQAAQVRSAGSG